MEDKCNDVYIYFSVSLQASDNDMDRVFTVTATKGKRSKNFFCFLAAETVS